MIFEASNEAVAGRCGIVATLALGAYIGLSRVHREPVAENSCTAVIHPWAKGGAAAGGAMAAYVVLENGGATLERLLAISSPMAEQIVMMEVGQARGSARAQEIDDLTLAPGVRLAFRPGERQLMLLGARGPIEAGSWVPIIFTFERGDAFQADLRVESLEESEHDDHR